MAIDEAITPLSPPAFLRLAGNPVRWRLLTELARSDLRVGELTARVGQPQNAVSYHLGRLRSGGLVRVRRSSADGRDSYYHADLERYGALLAEAGGALHPRLAGPYSPTSDPGAVRRHPRARKVRVLFLCTGNSARSPIAEALLTRAAGDVVEAASAGSHPKDLDPNAVRVLREYGVDIEGRRSKHLDAHAGRRFDHVITLCDRVREVCPEFPGSPERIHWSISDPAADGPGRASYLSFRRVAADIDSRVQFLVHWISAPTRKGSVA